jgi:hypothetical protein
MSIPSAVRPLLERPNWVPVNSDVVAGSRGGSFLGTVERTTVGFVAVDDRGEPRGFFDSRKRAQEALAALPPGQREKIERAGFLAASTAGALAAGLALIAGALAPLL